MNNRKVAAIVRKHKGEIVVTALVRDDTIPVRVYKNDILTILQQNLDGDGWEPSVSNGTLFLHPAHDVAEVK